ncbi:hypothetical protein [Flindersiella endophytica]
MHHAGSAEALARLGELASLLPEERRTTASIVEIIPEGSFVTYGLNVPLLAMRDPSVARGRVPVSEIT